MSIAGAYWRGSEKNPQLQRVYGALFETQEELEEYEHQLEEARRRDHRRIGRDLKLFDALSTRSGRAMSSGCPPARPSGAS